MKVTTAMGQSLSSQACHAGGAEEKVCGSYQVKNIYWCCRVAWYQLEEKVTEVRSIQRAEMSKGGDTMSMGMMHAADPSSCAFKMEVTGMCGRDATKRQDS